MPPKYLFNMHLGPLLCWGLHWPKSSEVLLRYSPTVIGHKMKFANSRHPPNQRTQSWFGKKTNKRCSSDLSDWRPRRTKWRGPNKITNSHQVEVGPKECNFLGCYYVMWWKNEWCLMKWSPCRGDNVMAWSDLKIPPDAASNTHLQY